MSKDSAHLTQARRERLLKLLSMNLNDMEANSGMEHLVEFKRAYGASVQAIQNCLRRFCPEVEAKKRRDAMEQAQVDFNICPFTRLP